MEESVCEVIQLDDWRFVALCDCCTEPVRRKDVRLVSRLDHDDKAEICRNCVGLYFDDDNYKIIKKC
jgi:hypothetical protein